MRASYPLPALLFLASQVHGALHQLIVGTFGTEALYTVEFDDATENLSLLKNTSTSAASSWITLSHDKKNLYGTSFNADTPTFVSYAIANATNLVPNNTTLALGGNCTGSTAQAIFVMAANDPPYAVYGSPFGGQDDAGCGVVMSVDATGALDEVVQNYTYASDSGVHGMGMNVQNSFLYSADDTANTLWTHSVDNATGALTLVDSLAGPATGSDPRHLTVHPAGQYLYVILEGTNQLAQYSIDQSSGIPSFQNVSFDLIPSGYEDSSYWSDEVALSKSLNYVWATSRARSDNSTGYISAFSLSTDGAIQEQLFLVPTTSSGGSANSVAPSEFSDQYVALTDSATGFVEVWSLAANDSSASVVAHLDLEDGGCCANAVWYS